MANRHVAEIGDVWKHLALAEIAARRRPRRYWETHAGSARYDLPDDASRRYGIGTFLTAAAGEPRLARSRYARVMATLSTGDGGPYPGSAYLVMAVAGAALTEVVLADTDPRSTADLRRAADDLGLTDALRTVDADGVGAVTDELGRLASASARGVLALVDPYRAFQAEGDATTPAVLATRLAAAGVATVLWYGFHDGASRRHAARELTAATAAADLDPRRTGLWAGEVALVDLPEDGPDPHPAGVAGCGIWTANLGSSATTGCTELGRALAGGWADARLPDGSAGALAFTEPSPW